MKGIWGVIVVLAMAAFASLVQAQQVTSHAPPPPPGGDPFEDLEEDAGGAGDPFNNVIVSPHIEWAEKIDGKSTQLLVKIIHGHAGLVGLPKGPLSSIKVGYGLNQRPSGDLKTWFQSAAKLTQPPAPGAPESEETLVMDFSEAAISPGGGDTIYFVMVGYYGDVEAPDPSNLGEETADVDLSAPGSITDLELTQTLGQLSVTLDWTAPGDDEDQYTVASYEARYTHIGEPWNIAKPFGQHPVPGPANSKQSLLFVASQVGPLRIYLVARDELGKESPVAQADIVLAMDPSSGSSDGGGVQGCSGSAVSMASLAPLLILLALTARLRR